MKKQQNKEVRLHRRPQKQQNSKQNEMHISASSKLKQIEQPTPLIKRSQITSYQKLQRLEDLTKKFKNTKPTRQILFTRGSLIKKHYYCLTQKLYYLSQISNVLRQISKDQTDSIQQFNNSIEFFKQLLENSKVKILQKSRQLGYVTKLKQSKSKLKENEEQNNVDNSNSKNSRSKNQLVKCSDQSDKSVINIKQKPKSQIDKQQLLYRQRQLVEQRILQEQHRRQIHQKQAQKQLQEKIKNQGQKLKQILKKKQQLQQKIQTNKQIREQKVSQARAKLYCIQRQVSNNQKQIEQTQNQKIFLTRKIQNLIQSNQNTSQLIQNIYKEQKQLLQEQNSLIESRNQLQVHYHQIHAQLVFKNNFLEQLYQNHGRSLYLLKKELNNQLQQIRGNIRVYCRIRPLTSFQGEPLKYQIKSNQNLYIKRPKNLQQKSNNSRSEHDFNFNHIFDQHASQQEVYSEISQLIQSAVDGNNVTIMTYGQTGSGKTFTMGGKRDKPGQEGLIYRSTKLIFKELQKFRNQTCQVELFVSVIEIYRDKIINVASDNKKEIKNINSPNENPFIQVKSMQQVQKIFEKAIGNRSTASTLSNSESSRSHLIFTMQIKTMISNQKPKQSHLVLVDLAGNERTKQSGVSGQRMDQANDINSSLSCLRQVFQSLKNKKPVNYRNSSLTKYLKPYLQNKCKAIMFVNISPAQKDYTQSINSLRFASETSACTMK